VVKREEAAAVQGLREPSQPGKDEGQGVEHDEGAPPEGIGGHPVLLVKKGQKGLTGKEICTTPRIESQKKEIVKRLAFFALL
jgi:hypothetical protein